MTVKASPLGSGEVALTFDDNALLQNLCGERNANLKLIERGLKVNPLYPSDINHAIQIL